MPTPLNDFMTKVCFSLSNLQFILWFSFASSLSGILITYSSSFFFQIPLPFYSFPFSRLHVYDLFCLSPSCYLSLLSGLSLLPSVNSLIDYCMPPDFSFTNHFGFPKILLFISSIPVSISSIIHLMYSVTFFLLQVPIIIWNVFPDAPNIIYYFFIRSELRPVCPLFLWCVCDLADFTQYLFLFVKCYICQFSKIKLPVL